ncbi:MAG: hypothetical protein KKG33_01110 [candidate division Zixibacteria bacterium]|nr:hypothetical protein [candidate division Zixibacteria bacterium]MBU1470640.1 hypothetical protein [candidate division Zixibacteria bacterium]MBU2624139.1 hypothetical protein [candidate division Zixibacteria bacterium]
MTFAQANKLGMTSVRVNRRKGFEVSGATPEAAATPDLEVADLKTLADMRPGSEIYR